MTGFDISFDSCQENRSVKESLTSDGVNGSSVLLSLCFIGSVNMYLSVISVFSAVETDREFTRFTVI